MNAYHKNKGNAGVYFFQSIGACKNIKFCVEKKEGKERPWYMSFQSRLDHMQIQKHYIHQTLTEQVAEYQQRDQLHK